MKSSGQLALRAMWHCWCLCEQLQLLTVSDSSLIYIIGGLVINGNCVWEDPIKIWSEIWSSPLLSAIYLQLHWHIRNYWDSYPHILWWNVEVCYSVRERKVFQNWFHVKASCLLVGHFPVLPLRGSIKTGSRSRTDTRTQSYNKRLSHYLLSSKSNNSELLSYVCDKIRTLLQF